MGLCCATERFETRSERRFPGRRSDPETLELKAFEDLQMNQWLGKFWNERRNFKIALIGDRESVGLSFLSNILGMKHRPIVGDSIRHLTVPFDGDGVRVDADLVPALSDTAGYKDEGYIRPVRYAMDKADLVIFCVNMSDTRLRGSVFRTFQQLKTDWSRTVIVLTFADALPALMRHRENPDFPKGQYFNTKLAEWTRELKAMLKRVGVQQELVAKMNVYPCAHEPEDLLPNGEPWLAPLSLAIMEILSPEKKEEFFKEHATIVSNVQVQSSTESNLQVSSAPCVLSEDQLQSIRAALSKLRKDCPVFGVLVVGRTGVGKSTLINSLLGKEVTSVGHTLKSETPTVNPHKATVEGVPIVVYDTPGLGDIKGEEDEAKHLDIMKDLLAEGKIHLVVYCFQMNKTIMISSHIGPLRKYHQIGVDWKRSVIALTFADALYVPKGDREHPMSNIFDQRLAFWQNELKEQLIQTVGVESDVVEQLKMYPTSQLPKDQLPNGGPWYVPLWLHIVEILSPAATIRYLDIHKNNICDEQAPPLSKYANTEVKLVKEDKDRFTVSLAATLSTAGMDSSENIHAFVKTAFESGVGEFCKLLNATSEQVTPQPLQDTARHTAVSASEEAALLQFKYFTERFLREVQSRDNLVFTAKLQRWNVIPERTRNMIAAADDNESANNILLDFVSHQWTDESLCKLIAAMIEAEDHPAMSKLGREMKAALGPYIYTSTDV